MKLTVLKNPFNTTQRDIYEVVCIPGKTIAQYAQPYLMGLDEFVYACNGKVVESAFVPQDGDYAAVCPVVGKKSGILSAILGLGLSIVTGGIASGSIWGITNSFMRGLVASAVGFLGGQLINHLFPPPTIDMPDFPQSTPSYGWGSLHAQTSQGGALPVTYGMMKTAGIELAKHITADGEKQYLNLLLSGGQGPADSITDIMINDNPIENYNGVTLDIRLGTNDQEVIENFNDTYGDQALSYELVLPKNGEPHKWATHRTEGNGAQGIELVFELPNGLYHMNNDGNLETGAVKIQAQYRWVDGDWQDWFIAEIKDNKNTAVRKVFRIDHLLAAQYEVRCKCLSKSGESTRDSTRIYWTQLSSIVYDDFCRPNKILIGIKALATEQLSGSDISVTWQQTVKQVNVYNPKTNQYEGKSAKNPAWVCYDLLHNCRKLKNIHTKKDEYVQCGGVTAGQIDYQAFESWAQHCDFLKLEFEYIFDAANSLWESLKIPESFGRGKVIAKGTRFSCVCDKPSVPVQLFTVGNMVESKFSKQYMSLTDRANAVEITFINKDKGYQKDAITVYDDDWNQESMVKNPTQVTLNGCSSYEQAFAHGKYLLRINKLMLRTCCWEADIDALACQVGDQVLVSHDVPQWGESGRILAATNDTLRLDRKVKMETNKAYSIVVRLSDDSLVTKDVANGVGDVDRLTLYEPFDHVPQEGDLFAFSEIKKEAKPFIIVDIARSGELTAAISGIEYVPAVYEESLDAPIIDYAPGVTSYEVLSASAVEETYHQKDGTMVSNINCSWQLPRGAPNKVALFYSTDDGKRWMSAGSGVDEFAVIHNARTLVTYLVKICAVSDLGILSRGLVCAPVYITGKDLPPAAPTGLRATEIDAGVLLTWDENKERDIAGYNIYQKEKFSGREKEIVSKQYKGTSIIVALQKDGIYIFYLQAVDNCGNESAVAELTYEIAVPADVIGFDVLQVGADLDFRWQPIAGCEYEIRAGQEWSYGLRIAQVSNCFLKTIYPIPGGHQFWIKAFNRYKRYSKNAVPAKIQLLGDNERNAIYKLRYAGRSWDERYINFSVISDGLLLDHDAMYGEYIALAKLPKKYVARNWINAHVVGTSDQCVTWDDAHFSWDSAEADMPWLPPGDITGLTVKQQIAVKNDGIAPDIIESYPLDGNAIGQLRGGKSKEERHISYELARFGQGALIGDLTKLSWNVSIPAVFHLVFFLRIKEKMQYDAIFMTIVGGGKLYLGYDFINNVFYLEDHLGRRNAARLDYRKRDYIAIGITQSGTKRGLFVSSFAAKNKNSAVEAYPAIGAFTAAYCYKK